MQDIDHKCPLGHPEETPSDASSDIDLPGNPYPEQHTCQCKYTSYCTDIQKICSQRSYKICCGYLCHWDLVQNCHMYLHLNDRSPHEGPCQSCLTIKTEWKDRQQDTYAQHDPGKPVYHCLYDRKDQYYHNQVADKPQWITLRKISPYSIKSQPFFGRALQDRRIASRKVNCCKWQTLQDNKYCHPECIPYKIWQKQCPDLFFKTVPYLCPDRNSRIAESRKNICTLQPAMTCDTPFSITCSHPGR